MADQRGESAAGCLLGLAFLALMFWRVVVSVLAIGLVLAALVWAVAAHRFGQLRGITLAASRRFVGDVCRVDGRFGVVRVLELQGTLTQPRIALVIDQLQEGAEGAELHTIPRRLEPPARLGGLRSNAGVARFLEANGITMVGDLAVEAKATRAALECLREVTWTRGALARLETLICPVADTLAKAEGNELLEPSIPQLQDALTAFGAERHKLEAALHESGTLLRKLHDFLAVPERIRPILSFDLDTLFDPQRLPALEQSFEEVVLLNDAFRELSRQKLA
jgi:hypothetical protein